MKATLDFENLEQIVQSTIEKNMQAIVENQVDIIIRGTVDKYAKELIENKVSEKFQNFMDDYIATTTIKTGGNYWSDEPEKEYTVEQYIKKELKDRLDGNILKAKKPGRKTSYSDDFEKVTFEEYIKRTFNPEELIKKELDQFMDDVRKDINKTMKDTFDNSTKNMLSSAVLNILTANDTYRQIENNIKCIADKKG